MLMILLYFPSGGCVDDVVNNQTNHQFTSVIVLHFMNSTKVSWIIRRIVFNAYICLNHSWRYKQRRDKKTRHQREFLKNLYNFYI